MQCERSGQHAVPHVQTHATVALRCKWHQNSGSNDPKGSHIQDPAFSAPLLSNTIHRVLEPRFDLRQTGRNWPTTTTNGGRGGWRSYRITAEARWRAGAGRHCRQREVACESKPGAAAASSEMRLRTESSSIGMSDKAPISCTYTSSMRLLDQRPRKRTSSGLSLRLWSHVAPPGRREPHDRWGNPAVGN